MAMTSQCDARRFLRVVRLWCWVAALLALALPLRAKIIFDVFVGLGLGLADRAVPDASWFPVSG
jgi:hypothetical protein